MHYLIRKPFRIGLQSLIIIAIVLSMIVSSAIPVYAASTYVVDSGYVLNQHQTGRNINPSAIVRWPTGRLHTVYNKQFGAVQEIYYAYSDDDGLNWIPVKLTNVGHDQIAPSIALTSNGDLHVTWIGRGEGSHANVYAVKYLKYDYSDSAWDSSNTIIDDTNSVAGFGDLAATIKVDGNDNIYIAWLWNDGGIGADYAYLVKATFNIITEEWTWGSREEVYNNSYQIGAGVDAVAWPISMAVDKDNNVGVTFSVNAGPINTGFKIRQASDQSWTAIEILASQSCENGILMASISGGDTVWRHIGQDGNTLYYAQKTGIGGAWTNYALIVTPVSSNSIVLTQEHGIGVPPVIYTT